MKQGWAIAHKWHQQTHMKSGYAVMMVSSRMPPVAGVSSVSLASPDFISAMSVTSTDSRNLTRSLPYLRACGEVVV